VERQALIRKLEAMLDDAERTQAFGSIEIELRNGKPLLVRTIKTELIQCQGNKTHDTNKTRY
jgi:hypothetical protein